MGGNVENFPTPENGSQEPLAETPDPLRRIVQWAESVDEGLIDCDDTDPLWAYIAEARTEIRSNFVPLSAAITALSGHESELTPTDVGAHTSTTENGPKNDTTASERGI